MKVLFHNQPHKGQTGDTIIEVLIGLAVLGLALGSGYALTNRSFHQGVASAERSQAQAIAQGQVELIKDAYFDTDKTHITAYKSHTDQSFCINATTAGQIGNPATNCSGYLGTIYDVDIKYNTTVSSFSVRTSWDSVVGSNKNQTILYYKVP